jgi:hypothetical protein
MFTHRSITLSRAIVGGALALALWLGSVEAYAAGACGNCFLTRLMMLSDGKVLVGTGLNMAGPCTNKTWMWFDSTTAKGKTLLAMVQSAYLAGKHTSMTGSNVCTSMNSSSYEELSKFEFYD